MFKRVIIILFVVFFFVHNVTECHAIVYPLTTQNNKFGIHILFTTELEQAARLVNSNGGDWGYVTIPIQATDRNIDKWQKFMDDARKHHVIPIIRIASENYFFETKVWRKPEDFDILDFANFLNSLDWPAKNKYIVILNEVNRGDEWQGEPNPEEYAHILSYAITAFKSVNEDFFIISAGLDNAAANSKTSINQYDFMARMENEVPGIFSQIDGLASHSYPNPAFSQPPWINTAKSISSFKFERNLAEKLGKKKYPVFITETGWSKEVVSENLIKSYVTEAYETVWSDRNIVAVTPFLLNAGPGPFEKFSFIDSNGNPSSSYLAIEEIVKIKGNPVLETDSKSELSPAVSEKLPLKTFRSGSQYEDSSVSSSKAKIATVFLRWFFKSLNVL